MMSNEAVVIMVIIMCNNIMIVRITKIKKKKTRNTNEISTVNLFHYTCVQINVRSYPIGEYNTSNMSVAN